MAVLDPLALRARRVRALFLCGMQEGVFPSHRRRRGLLSEDDRFELERLAGYDSAAPRIRSPPSDTSCTPPYRARRSCSC